MEMAGKQFFQLWKGSGQFSRRQFSPLMEMASKQFSSFMELLVQLCLTLCATVSYALCNCVLRLMEMVSKQSSPFMEMVSKQFSSFMELLVQLCLTLCATLSYVLWKWLANSPPRLWKWLASSPPRLWNCDRNLR